MSRIGLPPGFRRATSPVDPRLSRFRQWLPVQRSWTPQDTVSADEMNQNVRDSANFLLSPPRCHLALINKVPVQAYATVGSKMTPLPFDTLITDTDNMFDPNISSQANIHTPGLYKFKLWCSWDLNVTPGAYLLGLASISSGVWPIIPSARMKIAEDDRAVIQSNGFGTSCYIEGEYLSGGVDDYVQAFVGHTSTGAEISVTSAYLQLRFVGQS